MNTFTAHPILDQLSALGDQTRTRILALLERSEFTVSELCSVLQAAQPTISRHLKTLADDGWVEARADGRMRHYRLSASLDDPARALWRIVRSELAERPTFAEDAERASEVLNHRRLRSAEFFAGAAARWDEMRSELYGPAVGFTHLLGLLDDQWTLGDLGTGTGTLAETVSPFVTKVIGVDRSAEMLKAARHRLQRTSNVELRRGDLEKLPIEDGELDVAVMSLVLHAVVDPPKVLEGVYRALRPGGRLVVVDMRAHERGTGSGAGQVWPGFEPERIQAWLSDAGFERVSLSLLAPNPMAKGALLFLATARRENDLAHKTSIKIDPTHKDQS